MNNRVILALILLILTVLLSVFNLCDVSIESLIFDQSFYKYSDQSKKNHEPIIFSKSKYLNLPRRPSRNVICFLVASYAGELHYAVNPYPRLREKVHLLDKTFGDNNITDVIIFHTGYPFRTELLAIMESTRRHVEFVNIDNIFYRFSPGFRPHITEPNWSMKGKWNYHHMCYFWFKQVFEMKIIQKYRYIMRLDDDSQLEGKWPDLFTLMYQRGAIYVANQRTVDFEYVLRGTKLMRNLTETYVKQHKIKVRNPTMFTDFFNHSIEVPNYWNNFEIIDLFFTQRRDVLNFVKAIDDSKGIFVYRWGDAPLRYITLALFANANQILHREKLQLGYCHPC